MNMMIKLKDKVTPSNIFTALLVVFALAMLLSPDFKGLVSGNLMKIGLFQPKVPQGPVSEMAEVIDANSETETVRFRNPEGKIIDLSAQKGKVLFINFWATWCPPCIAEMPYINQLYEEFNDQEKLMFLMVDVDNNRDKSQKFMNKKGYDLPVYTPASAIPSSYMNGSIPTTLVLNKRGEVVLKHEGMGDFSNAKFKAFLNELIQE